MVQTAQRSALILTDEAPRLERFLAPLRRANLEITRAEHAWDADRQLRRAPFDLIVVGLPLLGVERLLKGVRDEACPSRRASVLVVGAGDELEPNDLAVGRLANRLLPGGCSPVEFQQEMDDLLDVAPRVAVSDGVRLAVTLPAGTRLELWLENLSRSGMLLRALETLPVGSDFGFALELESEPELIRGRARVVRHAGQNQVGHWGLGARFLALGGEAPQRLEALVDRALATSGGAPAPSPAAARDAIAFARHALGSAANDAAPVTKIPGGRDDLTALTPALDSQLERGLTRRLAAADWYVTGAELGLESLRAFSEILARIYENRRIGAAAERRLADLVEVRHRLTEFGLPEQDVATRVRILLEVRPALHRLFRELQGSADTQASGAARSPGAVAQAVLEIRRLLGELRAFENLAAQIADLRRLRFLPGAGSARRSPREIVDDYGTLAASHGIRLVEHQLRLRGGAQATAHAVELELDGLRRRLGAIHRRVYSARFGELATDDVVADLESPRLHQVLTETLAAGTEYLARSYAAYRHALQVIDADPGLLDRVERLAEVTPAPGAGRDAGETPVGAAGDAPV